MIAILEILGQNPQRSLSLFLRGLGLFVIGLCFVAIGYYYHHFWQVLGIVFITIACLVSAWGYLGILSNRWFHILNRNKVTTNFKDK